MYGAEFVVFSEINTKHIKVRAELTILEC